MTNNAPFRADHVGSLLRPARLHEARQQFKNGETTKEALRQIENEEIDRIVEKQAEIGLKGITDGEFRRTWFHLDFMEHLNGFEGFIPEHGYHFEGMETEKYDVRNTGKISFNENHPFLDDAEYLVNAVGDKGTAKFAIPSPNMFFNESVLNPEVYDDIEEYANDIAKTYQRAIQFFYDRGLRYLQLDDVYVAGLASDNVPWNEGKYSRDYLLKLAVRVVNESLKNKPEDMIVTTHLCRGNYRSTWAFEGGYEPISGELFAKEKVNGFFLEYDDERSGDFEPLRHIPENGPNVVLGLLTSKDGEVEDKQRIIDRVKEAETYVSLDQICLSPQCGFASTHHGNELTEEDQWRKLRHVVEIAEEIWND